MHQPRNRETERAVDGHSAPSGKTRKGLEGRAISQSCGLGSSIQSDCPSDTVQAKWASKGLEIRIPGLPLAVWKCQAPACCSQPFYCDTSPPQKNLTNSPCLTILCFPPCLKCSIASLVLHISRSLMIKSLALGPECFKEGMRSMAFSFLGPPLTVTSRFLNLEWVPGLAPPPFRPNSVPLLGG